MPKNDLTDEVCFAPDAERESKSVRIGIAALILSVAIIATFDWPHFFADIRQHGGRKESSSGRDYFRQTPVERQPHLSDSAPGWDSERAWSGHDDWEPFVAADRSSSFVYQMVTRFNPAVSGIFIRRSSDSGSSWLPDQLVGPISEWQADPQVTVTDNGIVFATWLDGPDWTSKLIKSSDHGATWTAPVVIAPSLSWTDHPWLLVSPDGQDVYVGLNMDDSYIVSSHDGGASFGQPIKTNPPTRGHWWDANGAAMAPDGAPYFVVINFFLNYRGRAEINVISSHDHGASWQTTLVDTSAPPPGCSYADGCEYGFLSSTAGIAIDRSGNMMLIYHAGGIEKEPEKMFISTSNDGVNWSPRTQISQPNDAASNAFPSIAAGPTPGDFRIVWQGNANGDPRGWDTYYRRTTDSGRSWSPILKLSNRPNGAPYKTAAGYFFPYGDYLSLSVDGAGRNHVIWGEGSSYTGPGGVWYTRGFPK